MSFRSQSHVQNGEQNVDCNYTPCRRIRPQGVCTQNSDLRKEELRFRPRQRAWPQLPPKPLIATRPRRPRNHNPLQCLLSRTRPKGQRHNPPRTELLALRVPVLKSSSFLLFSCSTAPFDLHSSAIVCECPKLPLVTCCRSSRFAHRCYRALRFAHRWSCCLWVVFERHCRCCFD